MSRETDGFLGRWSARKQAAREPVAEEVLEPAAEPEDDPEKTDAEILEELGLKDPDEMGEGDDFSGFMSGASPERLRNRALRKLWLTNPVLANLDELVDYGEDFTDAATVVENLQTAYRVGKGFLRREEIEAAEGTAEGEDPVEVAEAEDDATDADSPETEAAFSSDGREGEIGSPAATEVQEPIAVSSDATPEPVALPEEPYVPRPRRMVFRSA